MQRAGAKEGKMFKKIIVLVGIGIFFTVAMAFAGSDIKGAVINKSDNKGSANIAIGEGNKANMGSTDIENSKVKGAIINQSDNKGSANIAIGKGNEANMGSVNVK